MLSAATSPFFMYGMTWGFETWNWTNVLCKVRKLDTVVFTKVDQNLISDQGSFSRVKIVRHSKQKNSFISF